MRIWRGLTARRRRLVGCAVVVTGVAALLVPAAARDGGGGHQSREEIEALGELPEELTPLDPDNPNPTGDDPLAIGSPPARTAADSAEQFLAQAEARRDAEAAAAPAQKAMPGGTVPEPEPAPDSLLVSFAPGTSPGTIEAVLAEAGVDGAVIEEIATAEVDTAGKDQAAVTAALEEADEVEEVEPNLIRRATATPNDAEYASAQSSYLTTAGVPASWNVANRAGNIVVAVLDTGVDLDHPDLAPNLVAGRDIVSGDATPADDNGHGTEVAGVLGAVTNNGIGVAGVAWNTKVMPVKVLDAAGQGTDADIAEGIIWATTHGARIINLSLGGPGTSAVIDNAVKFATDSEVTVVAAAGNASSQVEFYPAGAPGVIGVTATDAAGKFAWFSNHGPWYFLSAPGINIRTTALAAGPTGAYTSGTGTSFSSPIVAGVAALVAERHPAWGWYKIGNELLRSARDAGPAGLDDVYGFGIVDAAAALGVNPRDPTSQVNLTGDAGNVQSTPRLIATGTSTETIGYEYDEDWFAFDVPNAATATITVTPPAALPAPAVRAAEIDPVVELYGPGGGLLAGADNTFVGEAETLAVGVDSGRHTLRVRNYLGSAGPGAYSVDIALGPALSAAAWASPQQVFAVDAYEQAVAVADFDRDGRDDVAMGTGSDSDPDNDNKIFVFTQDADGTLGEPVKLDTHATGPGHGDPLAAADLDGDGDVDLARGTASGLDVAWNEGGALSEPVLYPLDGAVGAIRVSDLDGAGAEELVVDGAGTLQVVRWDDGELAAQPLGFGAPAESTGIHYDVADLTRDARPDIAVFTDDDVAVHAQQDDGTWAEPTIVDVPGFDRTSTSNRVLALGDVNSDDLADIVAVTADSGGGSAGGTLVSLVGLPAGGFGPGATRDLPRVPAAATVADVTGDARGDVVVHFDDGSVGVFPQADDGTLGDMQTAGGASAISLASPSSMAIGDIDSDGVNDLVTAGYDDGLSLVSHQQLAALAVEGPGPWVSTSSPAEHATGVSRSISPSVTFGRDVKATSVNKATVAVVDGRGALVVDATVSLSGRKVTVNPAVDLQPGAPYQVVVAGVTDPSGTEFAYEVIPFTTASGAAPTYTASGTYIPFRVDFDGNGYDDIFLYGTGTAPDRLWFFDSLGRIVVAADIRGSYTPIAGDFDGDGFEDIFWYSPGSGTDVMWWNGFDEIVPEVISVTGTYIPIVGDYDRNGYDDIMWYARGTASDVLWKFGPSGRTRVSQTLNSTKFRPAGADFTRDGFDDIVFYAPGSDVERLWRGKATGFTKSNTMSLVDTFRTLPFDYNADGFHEVFLYNKDRSRIWKSGTTGFISTQAAPRLPSTVRPVGGDFTGDLRDDLYAYVPGTAVDRLYRGTSTGIG